MAEDKPTKSKRRVVKNPETFRERAVKASEGADKRGIIPTIFFGIVGLLGKVLGPIWRGLKKFFGLKALKPVRMLGNLLYKITFMSYFVGSWYELKKVTWPNWKQSRQLTFAVLVFATVFGVAIAIVDYGLDRLFRDILLK